CKCAAFRAGFRSVGRASQPTEHVCQRPQRLALLRFARFLIRTDAERDAGTLPASSVFITPYKIRTCNLKVEAAGIEPAGSKLQRIACQRLRKSPYPSGSVLGVRQWRGFVLPYLDRLARRSPS